MNYIEPKNATLLGDLEFDPETIKPLGGLNPYSVHFNTIGNRFKDLLIEFARLNPNSDILDVGCGTGRLAKSLCSFLDGGTYVGIDVNKRYVKYCSDTYKRSNFAFERIDVNNGEFNPNGAIEPQDFKFPYKDSSFDISVSIALFNHMQAKSIYRYIAEMSRVLRPNGILFFTAIILNSHSIPHIDKREKPPFMFQHRDLNSWHEYKSRPLINVAIPEDSLRRQMIDCRMMIKEPLRFGEWCQSPLAITGHDVITAIKGQWY
tara:strand:- start:1744 stop:2529 length:786 start_codon:yes stop_codon:yes gene_type:complete